MGGECFSGLAYGDAQALNVGGDEPSSANAGCDGPDVDAGSRFLVAAIQGDLSML